MMKQWMLLTLVVLLIVADVEAKKNKKKKDTSKNQFLHNGPFFSLPVVVGSQKTKLNVGVDGYYGASLIYGKEVACDGSDSYCVPHDTFDKEMSSSYVISNPSRSFEFTLGTADGFSGSDDLKVGSLKLKGTMFGIATSIPRHLNRKTKNSGHIAMNAPETDEAEKTTMQKIVEQASDPKITFYAPADMNGQHAITIGNEDTTHCKNNWAEFVNQPSVDPKHKPWTVNWQGFKWGSYAKTEKLNVALNPASDYFVAPRRHANYIYKQLNAKYSYDYSGGLVDCSKRSSAPNIEFTLPGGRKLIVTPQQYIKAFSSSTCLLNIYPDELDQWTLPYMFFQKYCVKFDYGKKMVSIADQM